MDDMYRLSIFVRCADNKGIQEEFLECLWLENTTRGIDVVNALDTL